MKRLLLSVSLLFIGTFVFTPVTHAVAADYTIDCSADTDPTEDNTEYVDEVLNSLSATVLTTNCQYSCADGDVDTVTNCGAAFHDAGASRIFTVTGPAYVHAYSPGSYGVQMNFFAKPELFNFSAQPGPESIYFSWNSVPHVAGYKVTKTKGSQNIWFCEVNSPETGCLVQGVKPGETATYKLTVAYLFGSIYTDQFYFASVDAAALSEELANTGSSPNWPAALGFVLLGGAFVFLGRRRVS